MGYTALTFLTFICFYHLNNNIDVSVLQAANGETLFAPLSKELRAAQLSL
jgi:hypothetical protein